MLFTLHNKLYPCPPQRNPEKYIVKSGISLADGPIHLRCKQRFFWLNHTAQSRRKINCVSLMCIGWFQY